MKSQSFVVVCKGIVSEGVRVREERKKRERRERERKKRKEREREEREGEKTISFELVMSLASSEGNLKASLSTKRYI